MQPVKISIAVMFVDEGVISNSRGSTPTQQLQNETAARWRTEKQRKKGEVTQRETDLK